MKRLYLHIGIHKTGTSSLQKLLKTNADELSSQGYFFRHEEGVARHASLTRIFMDEYRDTSGARRERIRSESEQAMEDLRNAGSDCAIVSSEGLAWLRDTQSIRALHDSLSGLADEIVVICVIRRQDELAVSHHQQGIKGGWLAYDYYGGNGPFDKVVQQDWDYLDFHDRYQNWASVFGADKVRLQIFDRDHFEGGDLLLQMCRLLDIPDPERLIRDRAANESLHAPAQYLLEHIDRHWPVREPGSGQNRRRRINALVRAWNRKQQERTRLLPARDQAETFYRRYADSNERLRAECFPQLASLFGDDFSRYPERDMRVDMTPADTVDLVRYLLRRVQFNDKNERRSQRATRQGRAA